MPFKGRLIVGRILPFNAENALVILMAIMFDCLPAEQ